MKTLTLSLLSSFFFLFSCQENSQDYLLVTDDPERLDLQSVILDQAEEVGKIKEIKNLANGKTVVVVEMIEGRQIPKDSELAIVKKSMYFRNIEFISGQSDQFYGHKDSIPLANKVEKDLTLDDLFEKMTDGMMEAVGEAFENMEWKETENEH